MIKVALVRGKYLNNYEGQNYSLKGKKVSITAIATKKPIDSNVNFPVIKLTSLSDFSGRLMKIATNRLLGDSQILFGLEKLNNKFDIFHSADPHYFYSYQLARLRRQNQIKSLILTSWETIPFNNETVYRKKLIKQFSKRYADFFLCYTNKAKECLIKEGVDGKKIKVMKLGVDLTRFDKRSRKVGDITLLFVGRLVEEKGIMDLYQSFKKAGIGKLRIVGSGPLEDKLNSLIRKDGLKQKIIIEKRSYQEMPSVYNQADLVIVPSKRSKTWEEQYGMASIEAIASGLPVIYYDTGAISENIGAVGIKVKEGDIDGLSNQIVRIANDQNLRSKLGTMSRKRAELLFDSKKFAQKISSFYETINGDFSKK